MRTGLTISLIGCDNDIVESIGQHSIADQFDVTSYQSGKEFLDALNPPVSGCIVVQNEPSKMAGIELLDKLCSRAGHMPVIIVSECLDVSVCSRAFKAGAFDFIEKPIDFNSLLESIRTALHHVDSDRQWANEIADIANLITSLTGRESEIMELLVAGQEAKQIAAHLSISKQSIARHRASIFRKLRVTNDVQLTRRVLLARQGMSRPKD